MNSVSRFLMRKIWSVRTRYTVADRQSWVPNLLMEETISISFFFSNRLLTMKRYEPMERYAETSTQAVKSNVQIDVWVVVNSLQIAD